MYIKDIPYIIHDLTSAYEQNKESLQVIKTLQHTSNELYSLYFSIAAKAEYSPEQYNGSHKGYISYQSQLFIINSIGNKKTSRLELTYNLNNESSYKIMILMKKIIIENEFIFFNDEIQSHADKKTIEKEKLKEMVIKQKLYALICEKPDGIEFSAIIQKSRSVKNPEKRKQLLKELMDENRIMLEFDTSQGRKKRIYKLI